MRLARFGLVAVLAAALAACSTSPPPTAAAFPGSPRQVVEARERSCSVGIVGDSLAVGIALFGEPTRLLAERGCTLTMSDTRMGRTVAEGAAVVETWQRLDLLPEVLVVVLGTNDCDGASMVSGVERILAAVGPDRPVVWQNTFRAGCDVAVNQALADVRAGEMATTGVCRLWVFDHHGAVTRRPALVHDGLHLATDEYLQRTRDLVELIAPSTVATPCERDAPPTDDEPGPPI